MKRTFALVIAAGVLFGLVSAIWSTAQPETVTAVAELTIFDDADDEVDLRTWAAREDQRVNELGALLLTDPSLQDIAHTVDLELGTSELQVHVIADPGTDVAGLANAYLEVTAADYARRDDAAVHGQMVRAERQAGVPMIVNPIRPHVSVDIDPDPYVRVVDNLSGLRSSLAASLPPGTLVAADGTTATGPEPLRDGLVGGLLALAVTAAMLGGTSAISRLRRRGASQPVGVVPLVSFDHLPAAAAITLVVAWLPLSQLAARVGGAHGSFALLAFALAVWLVRRQTSYGVMFAFWLIVLAPLAERFSVWADADAETVLVQGAPFLVSIALLPAVLRTGMPTGVLGRAVLVLTPIGVAAYGLGVVEHGPTAATVSLASFVAPAFVAFAAHRTIGRRQLRLALIDFLRGASVVSAGYAIVQWLIVPAWDAAWLDSSTVRSFGTTEPFSLRVFGTLSSPAALGTLLVAGIIVSIATGRARGVVVPVATFALLLTLHRTSWIMLVVALALLALQQRWGAKTVLRALAVGAAAAAGAAFVSSALRDRLTNLGRGFRDGSFADRWDNHREQVPDLLRDPLGEGFGVVGAGQRFGDGVDQINDSLMLDLMATVGPAVASVLLISGGVLWWRQRPSSGADGSTIAGWVTVSAFVAVTPLINIFEDPLGLWVGAAWLLATGAGTSAAQRPTAIVHDQLIQRGGAERVVMQLQRRDPTVPVVTTLFEPSGTYPEFADVDVRVLSPIPARRIGRFHRHALPYLAILAASTTINADAVVCSSASVAHLPRVRSGRKVVYCYTPPRWLYGFVDIDQDVAGTTKLAARVLAPWFRRLDRRGAATVESWAAISTVTHRRLDECYGAESVIIHPTVGVVDGPEKPVADLPDRYLLVVSRLLGYKNVGVAIKAAALIDAPIVIVGEGPQRARLEEAAGPKVTFLPSVTDDQLRWLYRRADVVVAVSFEDFGLTPVEAARFGRPIVALRWGGYLDTVDEDVTGLLVDEPEPGLVAARIVEARSRAWNAADFEAFAARFSAADFQHRVGRWLSEHGVHDAGTVQVVDAGAEVVE